MPKPHKRTRHSSPYLKKGVFWRGGDKGNLYLKQPGLALMAKISFNYSGLEDFLAGFPEKLGFSGFLTDTVLLPDGAILPDSSQAIRTAGPLCYMSFGPNRTKNSDSEKYINHLKEMGHWSVFRHAVFGCIFWGISRSVTHELVRHDFLEPSQTSQRYTTRDTLRFVERPEYQNYDVLHQVFLNHIDQLAQSYSELEEMLRTINIGPRKNRQQAARGILSNVVEAPIYVTANANAWRHFIDVRANYGADPEIRHLALLTLACLHHVDPIIFGDYSIEKAEDGHFVATSPYKGA